MTTTTQAGLVLALLAMLVLLLGLSRRQRRLRAEAAQGEGYGESAVPADPRDEQQDAQQDQHDEPEQHEPARAATSDESATAVLAAVPAAADEPVAEEPVATADAQDDLDERLEEDSIAEPPAEVPSEAAAPAQRRRGLFRRRKAVPEPDFGDLPPLVVAQEADDQPADEASPEAVEATADEPADAEVREGETREQAELRTLREQLRALEQVVQEQASEPPTAALARVEQAAAEQSAAYLRQVSMVVQGLAAHVPHEEHPQRTLARVAAAVERLGVPNTMRRPVLPVTTQPPTRRAPSHRREVPELEGPASGAPESGAATEGQVPEAPAAYEPDTVVDVFSNLDIAGEEYHRTPPSAAPTTWAAEPVVDETVSLDEAPLTHALLTEDPPVEQAHGAVGFDQSSAAAELSGGLPGGLDDLVIPPPLDEPELVLPVPPPAVIALDSRRRGRRRSST
ncbi:hypothetical protein [Nocardioides panaciterrulae]|uniref:Uncharacterized protein n=1 Tax=Nocardioides panaciterrulae TaxID=661492 RepID=A0A7Y9JBZ1_9ACTN|nr:hypothetical protein [Nocardioides panaciterrulae]NYD42863.1 hypothetical protein [Nocardioides panaciterrulae]